MENFKGIFVISPILNLNKLWLKNNHFVYIYIPNLEDKWEYILLRIPCFQDRVHRFIFGERFLGGKSTRDRCLVHWYWDLR